MIFMTASKHQDDDARFAALRKSMVAEQIKARGITDPRVLEAMEKVPRHKFLPPHLWDEAYDDGPLPIGYGQTISQPYVVAYMTEQLQLTGTEKCWKWAPVPATRPPYWRSWQKKCIPLKLCPNWATGLPAF